VADIRTARPDDLDAIFDLLSTRSRETFGSTDRWVAESERGRGLGRALLHHALRTYAGRGVARVGLKVDSDNPTGALELYARVGFVADRRYGTWTRAL
jgi:GNAT superfamily N-acetyltransferase